MFATRANWGAAVIVSAGDYADLDVDSSNHAHISYMSERTTYYINNSTGSFVAPITIIYDPRVYYKTNIKIDQSGYYHLTYQSRNWGGMCSWSWDSIGVATNAPTGNAGTGDDPTGTGCPGSGAIRFEKNALSLDSAGNTYVVYTKRDGQLYRGVIPSGTNSWVETLIGSGSSSSITSNGTDVGISYTDSGIKFIKDEGTGFGAPETVDTDGTNQSIVMGTYTYITYLKSDGVDQEVYEANNRPASSGAGSKLTFNYIVQPGDISADLDYLNTNSLDLNGGAIKDLAGNDASLTLATPGAANSLGFNKNIVIDTTAPTVELTTTAPDPTNVSPIPVTATFSEPVTGFEATDISVTNGAVTALSFAGSGTTYTFTVTPTTDGVVTVNIAGDVAIDAAANGNVAATPLLITYDTTPPEVTAVTFKEGGVDSDGLVKAGDVLTINVEFDEPMATSPVPTVAISGSNTLVATEMTRVDETHYTYDYTVTAPGDGDANVTIADGTDLATNPLVTYSSAKFVVDNTKPVIHQQFDITRDANSLGGRVINYFVFATDNHDRSFSLSVVCSPASGTKFVVNQTTLVTCNVSDQAGNAADPMTFNVTINPDEIAQLIVTAETPKTTTETSAVTVSGQDRYGNPTLNQSGTAVVVSADNGGALGSAILTLTNGVATTTLTKSTPGIVNVSAMSGTLIPGTTQVEFTKVDTEAPTISSFSPVNGATDVAINAPLFIIFNEPLDSHSVTSSNIKLMKVGTGDVPVDTQVSATVALVEGGRRVNIVPDSNLEYDKNYYFVVSGVSDEYGNTVSGEILNHSNSGFTTAENTADLTPPTVVGQSPLASATEVAINVHPYVDFSESMKSATITAGNIELKKDSDGSTVPASISLENGGTRAVINPTTDLEKNTVYYISVNGSVQDEAGNPMGSAYAGGSFTTVAPDTVVTITAPTGGTVSGGVSIVATNGDEYQIDGGTWIAITTAWDTTSVSNGSHTIRARGGTPAGYSDNVVVTVENRDPSAPFFIDQVPANGTTGVSINPAAIYVDFSEPLDPTTISSASVRLCSLSDPTCGSAISIGSPTLIEGGTRIKLGSPSITLDYNTTYWIQITTDVTDLDGNPISTYGSTTTSAFTTQTEPTGELSIGTAVMIKSNGLADNSYENGWEWKLRITLPTNENAVALKFADWTSGVNTLLAGGNMRYYSEQISSGTGSSGAPVAITAANVYPANIEILNDADPTTPGIQTDIHIQVKIPTTTVGGAYSSAFAVRSAVPVE
jgi:hypothetical protein